MGKIIVKRGSLEVSSDINDVVSITEAGQGIAITFSHGANLIFDQEIPFTTRKVISSISLNPNNNIIIDLLDIKTPVKITPSK